MPNSYFVLKRKKLCGHSTEIYAEQFFHLKDAKAWYKAIKGDALIEANFIIKPNIPEPPSKNPGET